MRTSENDEKNECEKKENESSDLCSVSQSQEKGRTPYRNIL